MLSVHELDAGYGALQILRGVSLRVASGQVVAIVGRNGAGKSTLLRSIVSHIRPWRGSIVWEGRELSNLPTHRIARSGIGYVPETRDIFASLTVAENLEVARVHAGDGEWHVDNVLAMFPRLAERLHFGGARLSGGEQQMLSIARALLQNPRLLILDEPTEGLAPGIIDTISQCLVTLKQSGCAILLVEQNSRFAAALAEQIVVLGKGEVRWHGTPQELQKEQRVHSAWIGI